MVDQIHLVIHIGKKLDHLLIVLHRENQGWLFRLVNSQGVILQEQTGKESATIAENQGKQWFKDNCHER